jgi:hypothetical protein
MSTLEEQAIAGAGATFSIGSDSYPCTVSEVIYFKTGERKGEIRSIGVRRDFYRKDWETGEESFTPDPTADLIWFDRKRGQLTSGGSRLSVGNRRYYQDPHF